MAQNGDYEPSEERSSFQQRKKSIMDGNRLRATYHNSGHAGRYDGQNTDEILFEFPINTDRTYIYFVSAVVGAEVENQNDGGPDRFPIINVAEGRTSGSGQSWTMNPITGYSRPVEESSEIARSDRGPGSPLGNTWPDYWPDKLEEGGDGWAGSWNGYFGRDQFNADLEFYYKAGDDLYTRFVEGTSRGEQFQPDKTDPTRGGLGILLDTRILAWSQTLINSTHFNIFEITNDGSYDYSKVAFGLWIADLIVGETDTPEFDDLRSIAFLSTEIRSPAPEEFNGPIGEMGIQFLETPGNSIDGIDNDGDSDSYNPGNGLLYDPDNDDLFAPLTETGGGFYSRDSLVSSVLPNFTILDFNEKTICPGDKIVLIQDNGDRIISTYPEAGESVYSRGQTITSDGSCVTVVEDLLPEEDENFGAHVDQIDNDFDGLIDENKPNHLNKATFINNQETVIAVRYINYLNFEVGDTLKRGMAVPNRAIREKLNSDDSFRQLVEDYQAQIRNVHGNSLSNEFISNYFYTPHTAAPMIDESRSDYFDNDQDWLIGQDDVGIEGDRDNPSRGQGDGYPTSGANTAFPGEPNIDVTDVSESDQLGVSRARIFAAGSFPMNQDVSVWNNFLVPGDFERQGEAGRDDDIFVSSSLFPLERGQTERFAVAITGVQTFSQNRQDDRDQTNANLRQAFNAYDNDYQFAVAPDPPVVTAVASDGKVTLYWDDSAEESFDRYVERITGNGYDFEGYRVYRATDEAFEDALTITDAYGNRQFNNPIVIYDRENGISGLHPVPVNGVQYNMGSDSGLRYSFVDSTVTNGRRYFYAITSFDYGAEVAGIAPSESRIQISRNPDGSIVLGQNVVEVRPAAEQAGFISPENPSATLVNGSPAGSVTVEVVDPIKVKKDNVYSVTFEDTLVAGKENQPDTVKTKNFTLRDVTDGRSDTLLARSTYFNGEDIPVIDGFGLEITNETDFGINRNLSDWYTTRDVLINNFEFVPANTRQNVADYMIVFSDTVGFGQSSNRQIERAPGDFQSYPSVPTNFKVYNLSDDEEIEFAYAPVTRTTGLCNFEPEAGPVGAFSAFRRTGGFTCAGALSDNIYFIEDFRGEQDVATYRVRMSVITGNEDGSTVTLSENPAGGDTLKIFLNKPFIEGDEYRFRIGEDNTARVDEEEAKQDMKEIKVVPNPYIVTNPYERRATSTNRQQQRELHFTHLPVPSTLRIFTVAGTLVREIDITGSNVRRVGGEFSGTYVWDMLTKDNLEISYGVYLYHVKAPGVGERTGKFAVIK
ncbi:hypothetical protein SAMN06265219_109156 [Gracilimonas mengyeensis]|uniref:Uncharacterized protein n=2 Tax=Gracilimonas mengyeensis TaxID=1302730 RepID=A0A521DVY8_9BACT|nr:hypothetical protein SAMN06265219_109156 [Gracilimonas mengyeensis]